MKEKYIKVTTVYGVLARFSLEAAVEWDMDGTVMCGKIRKELDKLPESEYVELQTATKTDKL